MKKKFRHHFSKNYFYGFLLFSSWFFLVFLAILACTGKNPFFALISVLFSLPCYFVVLYCAVLFLQPDEDENYTPYTSQTTVEGILDEKSRDEIDKDGDGRILISEYYPLSEEEVLQKILSVDSQFSKEDFYAWVKHLYSVILEALDKRNPVMLRRFESDYLYQRHVAFFEDITKTGAVISNYAIKGVLLKDFKIEGDKEILVAALSASIKKRNIYDNSYKSYILTFARKKGVKTTGTLLEKDTNCPNCGAVLDLDSHGVCSYCHTLVSNGDFGWILIDMKSIKLVGD